MHGCVPLLTSRLNFSLVNFPDVTDGRKRAPQGAEGTAVKRARGADGPEAAADAARRWLLTHYEPTKDQEVTLSREALHAKWLKKCARSGAAPIDMLLFGQLVVECFPLCMTFWKGGGERRLTFGLIRPRKASGEAPAAAEVVPDVRPPPLRPAPPRPGAYAPPPQDQPAIEPLRLRIGTPNT